ncbi:hypothetical protein EJ02DRAFT_463669 [Clathrospora elynae]|uniref:Uncharacterized protein n=1 Tax=Clathrospora elynae TaxID=706981 RepID=A0A6A5T2X8_9PLEO|nr:hypothetical protein EJ02DRAFT_463669 [Clathrospora elynae]
MCLHLKFTLVKLHTPVTMIVQLPSSGTDELRSGTSSLHQSADNFSAVTQTLTSSVANKNSSYFIITQTQINRKEKVSPQDGHLQLSRSRYPKLAPNPKSNTFTGERRDSPVEHGEKLGPTTRNWSSFATSITNTVDTSPQKVSGRSKNHLPTTSNPIQVTLAPLPADIQAEPNAAEHERRDHLEGRHEGRDPYGLASRPYIDAGEPVPWRHCKMCEEEQAWQYARTTVYRQYSPYTSRRQRYSPYTPHHDIFQHYSIPDSSKNLDSALNIGTVKKHLSENPEVIQNYRIHRGQPLQTISVESSHGEHALTLSQQQERRRIAQKEDDQSGMSKFIQKTLDTAASEGPPALNVPMATQVSTALQAGRNLLIRRIQEAEELASIYVNKQVKQVQGPILALFACLVGPKRST